MPPSATPTAENFVISPKMDAADWATIGSFYPFPAAEAKVFILLRNGLGTISDLANKASGLSQLGAFEDYTNVVINGTTYNGKITTALSSLWDGSFPLAVFVTT